MQSFDDAQASGSSQQPRELTDKGAHAAKNRGRVDVVAEVVNCCARSSSKSRIMLTANVNSIVATRMLTNLTQSGLLDSIREDGNVVYVATPKGLDFVRRYIDLQALLSPDLVPETKINNPNRLVSLTF